jgi:virginiamycin B lyase
MAKGGKCRSALACGLAPAVIALLGWSATARAQNVTEFQIPTPASEPNVIVAGPDGALWFTETNGNKIGRITTAGSITEFAIPTSAAHSVYVTAGSDGALWFTEYNGNKIGRITTSGTITEFNIPTSASGPAQIAPGPDGALWFTENSANKIGRVTTAGAVTEFAIPTSDSSPLGITAGPDGALWFAEETGGSMDTLMGSVTRPGKIGRITTAGSVTAEYGIGGFSGPVPGPMAIAAGPDGALWFTAVSLVNNLLSGINRISTVGTVTGYLESGSPYWISSGPDGALWFVGGLGIGRITTSGTITPVGAQISAGTLGTIAAGPDGALWFTEFAGNKIGRLSVPVSTSPLVAAVLPSSRSVEVGSTATAFATIINSGSSSVSGCTIAPVTTVPASFVYQTTDPATNALTGSPNKPATIAAGGSQSFVIAFTPNAPFVPTVVALGFDCASVDAAPSNIGLNTLLLSSSTTPVPDIVALAATAMNDGILHIAGTSGAGAFAVATVNVGASASITASANTGSVNLPLAISLCQTNPASGQCIASIGPSVTTTINTNATPTFGIFATASGSVPFVPQTNRIFVTFSDAGGVVRGSTSVAVETQ